MDLEKVYTEIVTHLQLLMQDHYIPAHGYEHFVAVKNHAVLALEHENLSELQKFEVEIAALLHDVDDEKIFPGNKNFENARLILNKAFVKGEKLKGEDKIIEDIITLISLVSCSKNGSSEPPEPWMAIPRDCDRLEAIGQIGIDRCRDLCIHKGWPFHLDTTPVAITEEEVWAAATQERYDRYASGVKSVSMLDHYYDKLLHIGKPETLKSQNKYILEEAAKRTKIMVQFVIYYWTHQNTIPDNIV